MNQKDYKAIAEIIRHHIKENENDRKQAWVTTATFELEQDVILIDFTSLPEIPSFFGIEDKLDFYRRTLINDFVRDFTLPVEHDGREHRDYVPTQVVTEYLRFKLPRLINKKIEGIIYPSSKDKNRSSIVSFWNHEECFGKVNMVNVETESIFKLKNNIIRLMYGVLSFQDFNSMFKEKNVFKIEMFSTINKLEPLGSIYVKVCTNIRPFNLMKVAKDFNPKCTRILVLNRGIYVSELLLD